MTVLMIGFPGFLGSASLPGILQRTDSAAICLVQRNVVRWLMFAIVGWPAQRPNCVRTVANMWPRSG